MLDWRVVSTGCVWKWSTTKSHHNYQYNVHPLNWQYFYYRAYIIPPSVMDPIHSAILACAMAEVTYRMHDFCQVCGS